MILGVGQLQPRKGIADFAEIARRSPEAQFIWVGGRPFGPLSAGISEIGALMAHPTGNLRFAGTFELTQMPMIYNAADCMLFPSFQENCPYAPMEAAACGLPVIFRDLPEYKFLYKPAYLAASDVAGFAGLLREILESASLRDLHGRASLRLAARYPSAQFIESLAHVYDQVACEAAAPS